MRRRRAAALLAALALWAVGCARSPAAPAPSGPAPSASAPGAVSPAGQGAPAFHDSLAGAAAEDGFYFLRAAAAGDGSVLCRLDFASGQSAPVCALEGCEHGDDGCPAYFSCYANLPVPLLWQGRLVLVFPGNPFAGEAADEANLPRVELAGTDGAGRWELARLSPGEQICPGFVTLGERLYFLTTPVEGRTYQPDWTLKCVDLATGKTDALAQYGGEDMAVGYYLAGCTEAGLLLHRVETTGVLAPTRESVASNIHSLMLADWQGSVLRPLRQWRQDEIAPCVSDGQLFYCDGEGRLFCNRLDGTEDRLALRLPAAVRPESVSWGACGEGWLSLAGRDGEDRTFRWLCDTRTGETVAWPGADRWPLSLGPAWSVFSNTPPGAGQTRLEQVATSGLLAGEGEFLPVE